MAWALGGALITQSSTDTNLAGLAGIAGVTTKVEGAGTYIKTRYYVPNGVSIAYSTLTFDPRYESLHFGSTVCLFYPVSAASVLTIGVQITQYSGTYANMSEAITFGNNSGNAYQQTSGVRFTLGALYWYSGIIRLQSCTGIGTISYNNGGVEPGTLTGYIGPNAVMEFMAVPSGQTNESCQVHIACAASFVIDGLTVRAYGTAPPTGLVSIATSTNYTTPPVFVMEGFGGITPQGNSRQSNFFTAYGLKLKACKKGLNWWLGSLVRGVNCSVGSNIPLMEHNVDITHPQGYGEIRNEVDVTCRNSSGVLAQDVRVYVKDTNNGDRQTYTAFSQNINNTADKTYFGSTDVNGNLKWLGNTSSILLCAVTRNTSGTVVGIDDSGLNKKDIRSLTNVKGTDDFRFHYWGYSIQYLSSIEIVQSDKVAYKIAQAFLTDTNVTLTKAAAEAKLASSFSVVTSTITLTAASTLDDVYDAMKAWKTAAVVAQVEYPTISTQPVDGVGTALTTSMNLVLNAIALTPGTKFKTIAAATLSSQFSVGGAYTYVAGTLTAPASAPTFTGGTANIGTANTYGFSTVGAIVSMTPSAPSTYTFTGAHTGTLDLRNAAAHAITVIVPRGTTTTTASNVGGVITVQFPDVSIPITGLVAGSTIQLWNATDSVELYCAVVAGTSYTHSMQYVADKALRLRVTSVTGATAYTPYESTGQLTVNGGNFVAAQVASATYNAWAINGSLQTQYTADISNIDIDITAGGSYTKKSIAAWWMYYLTTVTGIRNLWNAYTLESTTSIKQDISIIDVLLQNTATGTTVIFTDNDVRYYRSDFSIPYDTTPGFGSIFMDYSGVPLLPGALASTTAAAVWNSVVASYPTTGTFGLSASQTRTLAGLIPATV